MSSDLNIKLMKLIEYGKMKFQPIAFKIQRKWKWVEFL